MRRIAFSLFIFIAVFVSFSAYAQINNETNKINFSIQSSEKWTPIPRKALSSYSKELFNQAGYKVEYVAGYAHVNSSRWFDLPFILITSTEKKFPLSDWEKKYSEDELRKIISSAGEEIAKTITDEYQNMLPGIQVNQMTYDKDRRIIWTEGVWNIPKIGEIHAIIAMMSTEIGTLNLTLYVTSSEREKYLKEFDKFLQGVWIKPKYPPYPEEEDFGQAFLRGLTYVLIGIVIALLIKVYKLITRGKSDK